MGYSLSTPAVPPGAAPSMPMTASSFMPSNPTAPSSVDPDADTLPVQFGGSVQMRLDTLTVNFSRDLMQLKTYIDSKFQEALGEHEVKMISAITKVKSDLNTKFEAVALRCAYCHHHRPIDRVEHTTHAIHSQATRAIM